MTDDFTPADLAKDIELVESPAPEVLEVFEDTQVLERDGSGGHDSIDAYIGEEYADLSEIDVFETPKLGASATNMVPDETEEQQV